MGLKICSKCWQAKSAINKYFSSDKRHKDSLRSQCRECDRKDSKLYYQSHSEQKKKYYQKIRGSKLQKAKKRYTTIKGYLRSVYSNIEKRCSGKSKNLKDKIYIKKGVKNKFTSDEFVDYIINVLKIDPRGKQIHRINNNGHYEKSNIIFKTVKKHRRLHTAGRRQN